MDKNRGLREVEEILTIILNVESSDRVAQFLSSEI